MSPNIAGTLFSLPGEQPNVWCPGSDAADATCSSRSVPDFAAGLQSREHMQSRPLEGVQVGVVQEMAGPGVAESVASSVQHACRHLESLGASIREVGTCAWQLLLGRAHEYVL